MKTFRKLGSAAVAFAMLACSCIGVGAEERLDDPNASVSFDVKAKYTEGVSSDVYAVDIEWGSMEFEYTGAGTRWDPEKHEYVTTTEATWSANGNDITVTNHSSKPVEATLSYTAEDSYSAVYGSFTTESKVLASAVGTSVDEAPSFTAELTLGGELPASVTALTKVGSVSVALAPADGGTPDVNEPDNVVDPNLPPDIEYPVVVGHIRFYSRNEYDPYDESVDIYSHGNGSYTAEICLDEIMTNSDISPDTEIVIDGITYYIQKEGRGATFTAGESVQLSTAPIDADSENKPLRKETVLEAGKKYTLLITLTGDGNGMATLEAAAE